MYCVVYRLGLEYFKDYFFFKLIILRFLDIIMCYIVVIFIKDIDDENIEKKYYYGI